MNKTLKKIIIPLVITTGLAFSGCKETVENYIIDGNKVEKTKYPSNMKKDFLTEFQRDGDTIKFEYSPMGELRKLYINQAKYSRFVVEDYEKVWKSGVERFTYLNNKIDSINQKSNQERIKENVNKALEALESN